MRTTRHLSSQFSTEIILFTQMFHRNFCFECLHISVPREGLLFHRRKKWRTNPKCTVSMKNTRGAEVNYFKLCVTVRISMYQLLSFFHFLPIPLLSPDFSFIWAWWKYRECIWSTPPGGLFSFSSSFFFSIHWHTLQKISAYSWSLVLLFI